MKTIKIGLIGCGGIARRHVEWFLANTDPECEITALCDVSTDAMNERAEQIRGHQPDADISCVTDYRELLAMPELDGVAVLLPHSLHYQVALETLQAGKHLMIEKPMVTESKAAEDLVNTAADYGKIITIGYQRSYMSEYEYVRRMIESGELGNVQFLSAHLEQSWYPAFCSQGGNASWRSDANQAGGGQLVDCGSHTVAAMLDVTQLVPEEVFAFIENSDLPVDVNTTAAVRFTNGALGSLSIGGFGHSVTEVLRVVGDKHSARIFFRTVKEQALEIDGAVIDSKSCMEESTPNANFLEGIANDAPIQANGQLGLRVAQITEAFYQSAAEHMPVKVTNG